MPIPELSTCNRTKSHCAMLAWTSRKTNPSIQQTIRGWFKRQISMVFTIVTHSNDRRHDFSRTPWSLQAHLAKKEMPRRFNVIAEALVGQPIMLVMLWNLPQPALLILGLIFWIMALCSLKVLAMRYQHTIALHDRVRESRLLREEYLRAKQDAQSNG